MSTAPVTSDNPPNSPAIALAFPPLKIISVPALHISFCPFFNSTTSNLGIAVFIFSFDLFSFDLFSSNSNNLFFNS